MKFHQAGKLIILVSLVTILLTSLFYVLFLAHLWWVNVIFFSDNPLIGHGGISNPALFLEHIGGRIARPRRRTLIPYVARILPSIIIEIRGEVTADKVLTHAREPDLVALGAAAENGQVEALPFRGERDAIGEIRLGGTEILHIVVVQLVVLVHVGENRLAGLVVDALVIEPEEAPDGIALHEPGGEMDVTDLGALDEGKGRIQVGDLVGIVRDVAADAVTEIADGILPPEVQFDTLVADGAGVHVDRFLAGDEGRRHFHDQVVGKLGVPVQRGGKAVPEEAGLETVVELLGLFPGEVFVREFAGIGRVRDVDAIGQLIIAGALGDGGSILIIG